MLIIWKKLKVKSKKYGINGNFHEEKLIIWKKLKVLVNK